jgi:uncharacterized protein (TIGR02246 family)
MIFANRVDKMRNRSLFILAVVATLELLVGCETDQRATVIDADEQAIKTVIGEMTDAYAARDWDTFASNFADDGIWMPPGLAPLSGEDAWWSFAQQWWDSSTVLDIGVTTEELVVTGDWAIERHTEFQVSTFGDSAEPVSLYFKGVWIFRRQDDGSWKIARYIWNENISPD